MMRAMTVEVRRSAFNDVYFPFLTETHRYQLFFGGASSGKSFFIATRVVIDAFAGRNTLVVRNVARTLRNSCWNEISKAISRYGLTAYFKISKTEMVIECGLNGAQILFAGLDDVEKIKSITPKNGVLTDIWIEEATECDRGDVKQLDKRLRGASVHPKRVTLSFNPVYQTHWIYAEYFGIWDDTRNASFSDTVSILKTTYKDNRFLTDDDRRTLENERDEYFRNVYTYGNWGQLGDAIFHNWRVEDLSEYMQIRDRDYYGLDFGFAADPCAALRVRYEPDSRRVMILSEMYERGYTNAMLGDALKPFCGRNPITCDSAEPKSIVELRGLGINALSAKKGADSVVHGIQWLQGCEIIVDKRCAHMREELTLYQWRKNRDGISIAQPEDRNNHLIDALRYALCDVITSKRMQSIDKRLVL